jgi:hypothetical protein
MQLHTLECTEQPPKQVIILPKCQECGGREILNWTAAVPWNNLGRLKKIQSLASSLIDVIKTPTM